MAVPEIDSSSNHKLDPDQVLRAATALLKAIERSKKEIDSDKPTKKKDLFSAEDEKTTSEDEVPIWLVFSAKKHIVDQNRLKPGKIKVPHSLLTRDDIRICLITCDPPTDRPTAYKDLVASPAFPAALREKITKVIAMGRLKAKFKSFEQKRQLKAEYDVFLADDRIVTGLPAFLGAPFYKTTSKRPIPVDLTGKERFASKGRPAKDTLTVFKRSAHKDGGSAIVGAPADVAVEIEKALSSTLVHLAPSVTTSVKAALAGWQAKDVAENIEAIVPKMVEVYIPKKWNGVKSIHVKTPTSAALPIWLAEELWADEEQVLNSEETPVTLTKSQLKAQKRKSISDANAKEEATQPAKKLKSKDQDEKIDVKPKKLKTLKASKRAIVA